MEQQEITLSENYKAVKLYNTLVKEAESFKKAQEAKLQAFYKVKQFMSDHNVSNTEELNEMFKGIQKYSNETVENDKVNELAKKYDFAIKSQENLKDFAEFLQNKPDVENGTVNYLMNTDFVSFEKITLINEYKKLYTQDGHRELFVPSHYWEFIAAQLKQDSFNNKRGTDLKFNVMKNQDDLDHMKSVIDLHIEKGESFQVNLLSAVSDGYNRVTPYHYYPSVIKYDADTKELTYYELHQNANTKHSDDPEEDFQITKEMKIKIANFFADGNPGSGIFLHLLAQTQTEKGITLKLIESSPGIQSDSENCFIFAPVLLKHIAGAAAIDNVKPGMDDVYYTEENQDDPSERHLILYKTMQSKKALEKFIELYGDQEIKPNLTISKLISEKFIPEMRNDIAGNVEFKDINISIEESGYNMFSKVDHFIHDKSPDELLEFFKTNYKYTEYDTVHESIVNDIDAYSLHVENTLNHIYDYSL